MNVFLAYAKLLTLSFAKNFTILRVFTRTKIIELVPIYLRISFYITSNR